MKPTQELIFEKILDFRNQSVNAGIDEWPSMAYLKRRIGVGDSTISIHIKEMVEGGYLKYHPDWKNGQSKKVMFVNA